MGSRSDASSVLALTLSRPATLGAGRLVCIDGPSGSGKTTLALALARQSADVRVVHMDALYDGWGGLPRVSSQLATLLSPLAVGVAGRYRRYDWHAASYAEEVVVPPAPVLVLEGVGAWAPELADLVTVLVWVTAPADARMTRALSRDGEEFEPQLRQWAVDESAHFARTGARARADLVLDSDDPAAR